MEQIYKENELHVVAQNIVRELRSFDRSRAILVSLSGDLGAGKTTLVQEISKILGIKETVVSPTYVIMKKYNIENDDTFKKLIHIDAYRLGGDEELSRLGWSDFVEDPHSIVMVEWPEKVPGITRNPDFSISLTHHNDDSRKMVMVRYTKE